MYSSVLVANGSLKSESLISGAFIVAEDGKSDCFLPASESLEDNLF